MNILLSKFEQQIDKTILKRGRDYFKSGCVLDVEELGDGEYEATVEGTETYTVNVTVEEGVLTEYDCDCPYDMGPICKHVTAVLFYLQEKELPLKDISPVNAKAKKKDTRSKKKTVSQEIDSILEVLPQHELVSFIHGICMKDKDFRLRFLSKYTHLIYPVTPKEVYSKQIQALVGIHSERYGYVDYANARDLGRDVSEILDNIKADFAKEKYHQVMSATFVVLEEIIEVLGMADDSGGHIGACIEEAMEIIYMLTEAKIDESFRKELFECLITTFESGKLKGWDWHFTMINLAINLLKTTQEKDRIKNVLDKIKPSGDRWDWDYQEAQRLNLKLIQKTGSKDDVTLYLSENISNDDFREELIKRALNEKDYETAKKLANEGVIQDKKEFPGLADKWRSYLLDIARKTEDMDSIIRLARYFIIHSNGHQQTLEYYYSLLKTHVSTDLWPDCLKAIIAELSKEKGWISYSRISQLYIWEAHWEKLLGLLRQNVTLERISEAEKYLKKTYSSELVILYKEQILVYLARNMGRNHYREACRYIRRMMKLGNRQAALDLVGEIRSMYRTRRALLEELDRI